MILIIGKSVKNLQYKVWHTPLWRPKLSNNQSSKNLTFTTIFHVLNMYKTCKCNINMVRYCLDENAKIIFTQWRNCCRKHTWFCTANYLTSSFNNVFVFITICSSISTYWFLFLYPSSTMPGTWSPLTVTSVTIMQKYLKYKKGYNF